MDNEGFYKVYSRILDVLREEKCRPQDACVILTLILLETTEANAGSEPFDLFIPRLKKLIKDLAKVT